LPVVRALLLDCDPGIDDMVAILVACASPEIDLLGVTTVGGNVGIAATTRNARAVLRLAGRSEVPVAAGAGRSLVRAAERGAQRVHGDDGLGGIRLAEPDVPPDPRHAVDFLAAAITGATEPVTLVATGPLTNVALLYARYPDVAAKLARLVVMGGSIGAGNVTPAAEFNVWFDPEAAYRTLTEPGLPRPVRVTLVGLDLTLRATLGPADLDALRAGGPAGALVAEALDNYRHGYAGVPGVPVHDAVALTAAIRQDLFTGSEAFVDVDTGYGPSRGNTTVDLAGRLGRPPNVEVAVDADRAGVAAFIVDRVSRL
jgi:pyrimidine-specific ribonucleoside hydrolase